MSSVSGRSELAAGVGTGDWAKRETGVKSRKPPSSHTGAGDSGQRAGLGMIEYGIGLQVSGQEGWRATVARGSPKLAAVSD